MKKKLIGLNYIQLFLIVILLISPIIFSIIIKNTLSNFNVNSGASISMGGFIIVYFILYLFFIGIVLLIQKVVNYNIEYKDNLTINFKVINYIKKNTIKSIIFIIIYLISILLFTAVKLQDNLLFFPSHSREAEFILYNESSFTKLTINEDNEEYSGWGIIHEEETRPTIIFFGGNNQSSSRFFVEYSFLNGFRLFEGYNFIMIDYPGYGLSSSKPSEGNLYKMADVVYKYVSKLDNVDESNITIMGYSLGTGVASYVASKYNVSSLILLSPYSSILDVANSKVSIFKGPFKGLLHNHFDMSNIANKISCKTLIVYSKDDLVIPYKLSEKYISYLNNDVRDNIYRVENTSHGDMLIDIEVGNYIKDFLN